MYKIKMYYSLLLLLPVYLAFYKLTRSDTRIGAYYRIKNRKWKNLKNMVSSQYDSTYDIYRVSLKTLYTSIYDDIIAYFNNRVVKKGRKTYEVTYYIENQRYRLPLKVRRGPSKFIDAQNENGVSIIIVLKEYCSPDGSLNNKLLTPRYLGYSKIIIETLNGKLTFDEDEPIII
jgi:hypothetical protein